jgi:hypothetical protein
VPDVGVSIVSPFDCARVVEPGRIHPGGQTDSPIYDGIVISVLIRKGKTVRGNVYEVPLIQPDQAEPVGRNLSGVACRCGLSLVCCSAFDTA